MTLPDLLTKAVILSGILTGLWGLIHQFLVGGALNMLGKCDEKGARILMMSWIGHGAFLALAGFLPAILLIFHEPGEPSLLTTFYVLILAMLLFSIHVAITGLRLAATPARAGWVLLNVQTVLMLLLCLMVK